jgi:hypothetical protein
VLYSFILLFFFIYGDLKMSPITVMPNNSATTLRAMLEARQQSVQQSSFAQQQVMAQLLADQALIEADSQTQNTLKRMEATDRNNKLIGDKQLEMAQKAGQRAMVIQAALDSIKLAKDAIKATGDAGQKA